MTDASTLIMGSGGPPPFKFDEVGRTIKGRIVALDQNQQRDFVTGEPKVWKDGNPVMQAIVTLDTGETDDDIEDDDGLRRIFVASKAMREAIRDAIRAAGRTAPEIGGTLTVKHTGLGEAERGMNAPKLYKAKYEAPVAGANEDPFEDDLI